MLLDLNECKLKDNMRKLGIEENELSIQNAMCVALAQQALNGSIRAFQVIRDQLGQNPKDGQDKEHIENIIFINDITDKFKKKKIKICFTKNNFYYTILMNYFTFIRNSKII